MSFLTFYLIGVILSFPAAYYMNRYTDEKVPFLVIFFASSTSWAGVTASLGSIILTFLRLNGAYTKFNDNFKKGRL